MQRLHCRARDTPTHLPGGGVRRVSKKPGPVAADLLRPGEIPAGQCPTGDDRQRQVVEEIDFGALRRIGKTWVGHRRSDCGPGLHRHLPGSKCHSRVIQPQRAAHTRGSMPRTRTVKLSSATNGTHSRRKRKPRRRWAQASANQRAQRRGEGGAEHPLLPRTMRLRGQNPHLGLLGFPLTFGQRLKTVSKKH